ncbi:MAG: VCBS repeat-containing protein, partial [Candidatus Omnitrophica bacterium]|nr:VCBS repeat-containing protein [Candidatus Omnitrophota bacterium]
AIRDLTGDGQKDIVSGRYFYRNPGGDMTGTWPRVDFGKNVDAILALDVDGDAFGDVIAQALPDLWWLEANDRNGSRWTFRRIGSVPKATHVNSQGFALGQIIPEAKPEIVVAGGDGIYYFEIPDAPERELWPRIHVTTESSDEGLDVADMDADGWPDIVAGNGEKYVAWWKNPANAKGNWQRFRLGTTTPHLADRIRVGDMNGDGKTDVVVTEERYPGKEPDANLWWFEQPVEPTSDNWPRHHIITEYSLNNLDVADFDLDGDLDIVTCEHKGPNLKLQIFENDGAGDFFEHVVDQGKESHLGTLAADLDADGDLDLVSIAWDNYRNLHIWRNDAIVTGQDPLGAGRGSSKGTVRP